MDYSSDWLLDLQNQYRKESKKNPVFISDWDVINEKASYPELILDTALKKSKKSSFRYLFADEQIFTKEKIKYLLENGNASVETKQITLTVSATASLYLTILSLEKKGIKRFLVFTPVYYAILDTLRDIDANVSYFPLVDSEDYKVDFQKLENHVKDQKIECIFFVDPIYSGGIEIKQDVYGFLTKISNENDIYLVCDYTLGGLEWDNSFYSTFPYQKIQTLNKCKKFIFIDSISKRLLINGLKISVVIGDPDLILEIENYASQVYGGFSAPQIEFANEIYSEENISDVSDMIGKNVMVMKDNYEVVKTILKDTHYHLLPANSAYFTMIAHNELRTDEVNAKQIIKNFLFEENLLAFPSFHFSFHTLNKFAFRINVFRDMGTSIAPLEKCIRKNIKRLNEL